MSVCWSVRYFFLNFRTSIRKMLVYLPLCISKFDSSRPFKIKISREVFYSNYNSVHFNKFVLFIFSGVRSKPWDLLSDRFLHTRRPDGASHERRRVHLAPQRRDPHLFSLVGHQSACSKIFGFRVEEIFGVGRGQKSYLQICKITRGPKIVLKMPLSLGYFLRCTNLQRGTLTSKYFQCLKAWCFFSFFGPRFLPLGSHSTRVMLS